MPVVRSIWYVAGTPLLSVHWSSTEEASSGIADTIVGALATRCGSYEHPANPNSSTIGTTIAGTSRSRTSQPIYVTGGHLVATSMASMNHSSLGCSANPARFWVPHALQITCPS